MSPSFAPVFWILDTRPLWNGTKITDAAPDALALVSPAEQEKAKKFFFLRDAKLSLGSSLLKRLFITKTLEEPWSSITFGRKDDPKNGKPCFVPPGGSASPVDFNVTHQAGLVGLIGCSAADAEVGVDLTCVHERNDLKFIQKEGFAAWIDMHADVFSEADIAQMKADEAAASEAESLELRVRRFYAYWALKEAYVKLVGEALLAKWLKDTVFKNVRVPVAGTGGTEGKWGSVVDGIEVWRDGVRIERVEMVLQAFEENYLIATGIKTHEGSEGIGRPEYRLLDLGREVLPFAED